MHSTKKLRDAIELFGALVAKQFPTHRGMIMDQVPPARSPSHDAAIRLTAKRVRIVELFNGDKSIGRFEIKSQWKGFSHLVEYQNSILSTSPRELIIRGLGEDISEIFAGIFATDEGRSVSLIQYCPKLAAELSLKRGE